MRLEACHDIPSQGHYAACKVLATHLGLEEVTPEDLNSFERLRLEESTKKKIKEMQEEIVRRINVRNFPLLIPSLCHGAAASKVSQCRRYSIKALQQDLVMKISVCSPPLFCLIFVEILPLKQIMRCRRQKLRKDRLEEAILEEIVGRINL